MSPPNRQDLNPCACEPNNTNTHCRAHGDCSCCAWQRIDPGISYRVIMEAIKNTAESGIQLLVAGDQVTSQQMADLFAEIANAANHALEKGTLIC